MIRSRAIRESAKGEQCTLNIAGVCNYNPETTVLAHLPDESHGMGQKVDDFISCYSCSTCHMYIDGIYANDGERGAEFKTMREWYFRRAMVRTWRRLIEKGLVIIK